MWIINNSLDVLHTLEDRQLSLTKMSTWDFSTLYTSLKHAKLKQQLHELLEGVFNTGEQRASSLLIIFTLSGRMIMIGSLIETTLTSPVASFASLLTHLRPLRKLRFPAKLILVYLWALTVNPCWPICFFTPSSMTLCLTPWNKIWQKPFSPATLFDTLTIYWALTMSNLKITSAQFTLRNWN